MNTIVYDYSAHIYAFVGYRTTIATSEDSYIKSVSVFIFSRKDFFRVLQTNLYIFDTSSQVVSNFSHLSGCVVVCQCCLNLNCPSNK